MNFLAKGCILEQNAVRAIMEIQDQIVDTILQLQSFSSISTDMLMHLEGRRLWFYTDRARFLQQFIIRIVVGSIMMIWIYSRITNLITGIRC